MANFKEAFLKTEKSEGKNIWTKISGDSGQETWSGISRRANPNWKGWKLLDKIPNKKNYQNISSLELENLKQELYFNNYWKTIRGNEIKNQKIANDLYDTSVNMGTHTSIRLSQKQFKMKETGIMDSNLLIKLNSIV